MTVLRKAMAGVFVLGLLVAQLGLTGTAHADSSGVDSYIELSATKPASGCTIDGSFEVRSDGYPVAGVEVFIGLYVGTDLISSDSALTDDNGVTYLSIDPSAADGADAWIDVTLNDTYWWGTASYPGAGGTCYDGALNANKSGQIAGAPSSTDDASSAPSSNAHVSSDAVIIPEVGFYVQQRNLSCEYAAVYIATAAWGNGISEYATEATVGWSDNPHEGYRGNINGWWGNTYDYGVYAEPLSWALAQYGFVGEVAYTHGDPSWLMNEIAAGNPTIVWLGMWGDQSVYEAGYRVVAGMHVMVAYGYDDGGVYLSDPATGGSRYYDWGTFEWMWGVMDGMSLSVYPA
jgi:uncharacterized protein YvpB